jgi:hypothetical protein
MNLTFLRTLRSPSSERYVLRTDVASKEAADAAALDLHYLADGSVAGTLVILDKSLSKQEQIEALLEQIDEVLLPMVNINDKNLHFTVVSGKVIGNFAPRKD